MTLQPVQLNDVKLPSTSPPLQPDPIAFSADPPEAISGTEFLLVNVPPVAAELLDLVLPPHSPPLHRDLYVKSAFGTQTSSKPMARLETVVHATPDKVKEYFTELGSRAWSSKRVNTVVKERKESGEYVVAYKIQGNKVRYVDTEERTTNQCIHQQ